MIPISFLLILNILNNRTNHTFEETGIGDDDNDVGRTKKAVSAVRYLIHMAGPQRPASNNQKQHDT